MKRLVEYVGYAGRMGEITGRFVADDAAWARLQDLIKSGDEVYFGEVLGKHSEVVMSIEEGDIKIITANQEWLAMASKYGIDLDTGYNPLDYCEEDE